MLQLEGGEEGAGEGKEREGVWKSSAAVPVRGLLVWGFLVKVLVRMAVHRVGFGNRRVARAVSNRHFPMRSRKGSRTVTVETLRMRKPVNHGRRKHRTFSREQLPTVLDANAQETSTIGAIASKKAKLDGAALSTRLVLLKSLSFGSTQVVWRSADRLKPMSRATYFSQCETRPLRVRCRQAEARLLREAYAVDQVPEPIMQEFLGTVPNGVHGVGPCALAILGRRGVQAPP